MRGIKIAVYAIWLLLIVILQPTLIQWIGIFGVSPNIFLVFVISAAFLRGKTEGAVCGFIFGMVFDIMTGRMVGLSAAVFMYCALSAGVFKERFFSGTGSLSAAVFIAAAAAAYGLIYYTGYNMVWGDIGFTRALARVILPETLYTAAAGFVLFAPIRKSLSFMGGKRPVY